MNLYTKATIRTIKETHIYFLYVSVITEIMRRKGDKRRIATAVNSKAKTLKSMPTLPLLFQKAEILDDIVPTYKKMIGRIKNKAFYDICHKSNYVRTHSRYTAS